MRVTQIFDNLYGYSDKALIDVKVKGRHYRTVDRERFSPSVIFGASFGMSMDREAQ